MLLTMNPKDGKKLKAGEQMTPEMAQKAIKKAMNESPKHKETFNKIPVFTIAQMRMQKQPAKGESAEVHVNLLPMFFSLQNMVGMWQQFMQQSTPQMQGFAKRADAFFCRRHCFDTVQLHLKVFEGQCA